MRQLAMHLCLNTARTTKRCSSTAGVSVTSSIKCLRRRPRYANIILSENCFISQLICRAATILAHTSLDKMETIATRGHGHCELLWTRVISELIRFFLSYSYMGFTSFSASTHTHKKSPDRADHQMSEESHTFGRLQLISPNCHKFDPFLRS